MIRDTTATFTSEEKTDVDMAALMKARHDSLLVVGDVGACAGFITWGPFRSGTGYAKTAEHSIITETHGEGVGRALMDAAIAHARNQGIHVMVGGIANENTGAISFHRRLGFALAGQLPQVGWKMGRWHDLILMSRIISGP